VKYKFIFGNTPDLAQAELEAVDPSDNDNPQELIKRLGGTVKIAEILPENVKLSEIIHGDFGISDLTGKVNILQLCKNIKEETGGRFVLPKMGSRELSSVVVAKQKLTEIIVGDGWLGKTVAVQDFEEWGRRDYGRPEVEAHIGMLPPKVARMMLNIAVSGKRLAVSTVLDPFCGVGTILMEGCELGLTMIGSDIGPKQVARTKKNLESFGMKAQVFVGDARDVKEKVDAIVTEADLGPNDQRSITNDQQTKLHRLYLDCFKNWKNLTKRIVIALPDEEIIDKVINMGYILEAGPFKYGRPQAKVKRHILVFKNVTR
jgi:hypothetical protein